MQTIKVKKEKLLKVLKKNRAEHRQVFLEAQKGYRAKVIQVLDEQLKKAREGAPFEVMSVARLEAPRDYTKTYDRVIGMVEMAEDKVFQLSESEFANYVQDIWSWSRDWLTSNTAYAASSPKLASVRNALGDE